MSDNPIQPNDKPAGGWGALRSVARHLFAQGAPAHGAKTLLSVNQPDGFDCPGCAWPDRDHTSTFEFCENGAKAVAAEATRHRATPELFAKYTVAALASHSDHWLENQGRLTHPLGWDSASDRYLPLAWDEAFALIASHLNGLASPNEAIFYTSGRTSNEAAFLYQLFVREFGTNNFPDCSNMCHEPSGVALKAQIGVGKGTVSLHDFELADAILIFGQNPGSNHPRMLGELRLAAKRGAAIVSFNPLRERGLEKFADPQNTLEMLSGGSTRIAGVSSTGAVVATCGGASAIALASPGGGARSVFSTRSTRGSRSARLRGEASGSGPGGASNPLTRSRRTHCSITIAAIAASVTDRSIRRSPVPRETATPLSPRATRATHAAHAPADTPRATRA